MNTLKPPRFMASLFTSLGVSAHPVPSHGPRDYQAPAVPGETNARPHQYPRKSVTPGAMQPRRQSAFAAVLVTVTACMTILAPGMASAQTIDNPPLMPMDIQVFPSRDFTSVAGFAKNADVLIQVRRSGVVSDAVGRTDATGSIEVNHPGGVCWRNVTPDIVAGDTIRVTYRDTNNNRALVPIPVKDSGAATNTQNVAATQAFDPGDGTVMVRGSAALPGGARIPLNRLEVRIVNPEFTASGSRIGKRDIRADSAGGRIDNSAGNPISGTSATLAYDATGNTFTAVFKGLTAFERQLVVEGQTRVMGWQQTTAAGDRLGMTIFEVGEVGGPGFGGCPFGPGPVAQPGAPTAPVHYVPTDLLDASVQTNQASLKDVVVFPERDFISIEGFPAGTELQIVVRRGANDTPVIGTARGIVGRSGIFEINHPGGVCWTGQTPNISAGDMIDAFVVFQGSFSSGQTQRVIDAKVTKPAFINADGDVRVNGTAINNGVPLPLDLMEQRIINPDFATTVIGRRDIRADTSGGRIENIVGSSGRLLRTGDTTSNEWRAVYKGLDATQKQMAIAGQSRAMAWFTTNANGDRFGLTISEFGEVGGPGMGGCPPAGGAQIAIP